MRLEYRVDVSQIDIPRFSVEAQDRIGKLFTLTTLVFNVLDSKPALEIVFHGLNPEEPAKKIAAFKEIVASVKTAAAPRFTADAAGQIAESSVHFQWLRVER
jgi:hypothetical protein